MARKQGSHSEITGPKVRDAALRLIARHGYAAVSMRQIAAEVGVQAGALYNYTPDKQSLLQDLMRSHMEDLLSAARRELGGGTPLERLKAFVTFHIRFHLPRVDQVFVAYMELRSLEPVAFAEIEKLRRTYENILQNILIDGQQEGTLAVPDARVTTMALIGLLTGMTNWYREGGRLPMEEIEALYWELVRKAVAL